jgi:hypothetical protein
MRRIQSLNQLRKNCIYKLINTEKSEYIIKFIEFECENYRFNILYKTLKGKEELPSEIGVIPIPEGNIKFNKSFKIWKLTKKEAFVDEI